MTVAEAIDKLKEIDLNQGHPASDEAKQNLKLAIKKLNKISGITGYEITPRLETLVTEKIPDPYMSSAECKNTWAENVYFEVLSECRLIGCKQYLCTHKNKIDGEAAQWATTIVQGIVGAISLIFAFLIGFKVLPNIFGKDTDTLYYIIGTVGQQIVAVVVAVVIAVINKKRLRSKYNNSAYSFEELMSVKYAESKVTLFLPANIKTLIAGNGNNYKSKVIVKPGAKYSQGNNNTVK